MDARAMKMAQARRMAGRAMPAGSSADAMGRAMMRPGMKKGGSVKSSASKRADGCAVRGKTKGKFV